MPLQTCYPLYLSAPEVSRRRPVYSASAPVHSPPLLTTPMWQEYLSAPVGSPFRGSIFPPPLPPSTTLLFHLRPASHRLCWFLGDLSHNYTILLSYFLCANASTALCCPVYWFLLVSSDDWIIFPWVSFCALERGQSASTPCQSLVPALAQALLDHDPPPPPYL